MREGVRDRTELQHTDPHSIGHNRVSFPFSWAAQPGAQPLWVLVFPTASYLQLVWSPNWLIGGLRAPSAGCWLSLPHLVSNWLNFLCTELYNSSTSTFFLWASQIALIQPMQGQGYTLLFLDQMHLLFTQVHFLFWQPGRVVDWAKKTLLTKRTEESYRSAVAKVLNCKILESKFKIQLRYCVHFRTNALRKCMKPFFFNYRLNSTNTVLLLGWLWHSITHECLIGHQTKKPNLNNE